LKIPVRINGGAHHMVPVGDDGVVNVEIAPAEIPIRVVRLILRQLRYRAVRRRDRRTPLCGRQQQQQHAVQAGRSRRRSSGAAPLMAWVKPRKRKDGSVYFCVYFRELNHQTGKKAQTSLSWDNFEDAEQCRQLIDQLGPEKAREILRIVQTPGSVQTVRQFLLKHIDHLTGVEQGTLARYRAYVRNDIGPALGEIPLTALSRDDVSRWIAQMAADGASGKTVANKHGFLAGALNVGVRAGDLKSNPCEGMRLPRWDREDMTFLDLRHTCASWLIQSGRPLPAIQAQLGHESIQTTVGVYGHLDRSSGRDNADVIGAMLRPQQ
jgi:hypothetical protein